MSVPLPMLVRLGITAWIGVLIVALAGALIGDSGPRRPYFVAAYALAMLVPAVLYMSRRVQGRDDLGRPLPAWAWLFVAAWLVGGAVRVVFAVVR